MQIACGDDDYYPTKKKRKKIMTINWMATISLNRFPIETLSVQVGPTHSRGGHLQY